jgi:eukaryotic-like serine/threonine-protein kinase
MMTGELVAGRYRLAAPIGEGATGTVYRAEVDGEVVAVKILRQGATGAEASRREASRRFEREAVAVGKLDHPNLVAIRDFGALDDGRPYLVMDLVEGRSLAAVLAEAGKLPPERALSILAHLLRGLGHAHAGGVVHRDLKPADILLVDRDGDPDTAVIVDFGTAALVGAAGATAEQLTSAGAALGTPAYMAPERLDPSAGPIDGRADLYSATCILFEMLTGSPPYGSGEAPELVARHATAPVPGLGVDAGLDAIAARGLAKKPAERFVDADEYLRAVDAYRDGTFDPDTLGKPTPLEAGKLASPDPSKATTVFHGAPIPTPPPAAAVDPAAAPSPRRRVWLYAGVAGAAVLIAAVILVMRGFTSEPPAPTGDPTVGLADAWRAAGLAPGEFAAVDGNDYGGGTCRKGIVSEVDVVICLHHTPTQAREARRTGLRALKGAAVRTGIPSGQRLLLAASNKGRDPDRTLSKVTEAFQKLPPLGEEKAAKSRRRSREPK